MLADGSIREMESRGSVIKNKEGQVIRVVVVSRDVTERKRLQEQVHQMAFHDPLTRLLIAGCSAIACAKPWRRVRVVHVLAL